MSVDLATKLTVVSMYARGRRSSAIADATTLPVSVVSDIGRNYGAPDLGKLAAAAEQLRKQLGHEAPAAEVVGVDQLAALAAEAERIGSAKLVRRAQWIAEKLDELRLDVAALAKRYEAEESTRAVRARLAELRAEEATLRAQLNSSGGGKVSSSESAAIRAWAAAAGVTCHPHGRVPEAVRDAYAGRPQ